MTIYRVGVRRGRKAVGHVYVQARDRDHAKHIAYWRGFDITDIDEVAEEQVDKSARIFGDVSIDRPPPLPLRLEDCIVIRHPILVVAIGSFFGCLAAIVVATVLFGR